MLTSHMVKGYLLITNGYKKVVAQRLLLWYNIYIELRNKRRENYEKY